VPGWVVVAVALVLVGGIALVVWLSPAF
jgi:hypothetical protein